MTQVTNNMQSEKTVTSSETTTTGLEDITGTPVQLKDLECRYGDVVAVDRISLDIAPGEFVSLLGPSGSGKTTTLMMMAGFAQPTFGSILVGGRNMAEIPPHKRDIGMVFQSYALFPHMSVADNVDYPLRVRGVSKSERAARTAKALELVRLPIKDFGSRKPPQLSGGQQQRVALARALVYEPRVLLMDEPMGALDRNLRSTLQLEIKALHERIGVTIVNVTHDQEEALTMSDRIALFREGKIEQFGTARELYEEPVSAFAARFLGEANILDPAQAGTLGSLDPSGNPSRTMIRPERVRITSPESGLVSGRLQEVVYLGGITRATVDTTVGPFIVKVPSAEARLTRDDIVGLSWHPSAAVPVSE